MKQALLTGIASLFSALLAVGIYAYFNPGAGKNQAALTPPVQYTGGMDTRLLQEPFSRSESFFSSSRPDHFTVAAQKVTPAVVNIRAINNRPLDWFRSSGPSASSGSGVVLSADGYVVTNYHVVEGADSYEVTLSDKREYPARLVGKDPSTDLALLKVEAQGLSFLHFGNSDSLLVGEWVLAVGNPFNLESTVTAGIVSAKGRNIDILEGEYSIESFIQTDAAVNPGNSGGALVNTRGDLVGINTAIITRSGRYEGYSFAVPSNLAQKIISDLREFGEVQRGILGVGIGELTSRIAHQLGLTNAEGVYVTRVTPNGGAYQAGIRKGDVILSINGIKVRTMPELQEIVARYRPGDKLQVTYFRDQDTTTVQVILYNQYNSTQLSVGAEGNQILQNLGLELRDLRESEAKQLGKSGVYVVSILNGSLIENTQMDPGYVITHVNNRRVRQVEEVLTMLSQISAGEEIILEGFYEGYEGEYYYTFKKP